MDIFKMIYGWLSLLLVFIIVFYYKKMEIRYKNVGKGTIKWVYLYDILGLTGIICIPYSIVAIFLVGGFNTATVICNSILFLFFIFSLFCFICAKLYSIEYSGNFFVIKKFKNNVKYNYDEVDVVIKQSLFRVYKNGKKICTISHKFQQNSYDFLKKISK